MPPPDPIEIPPVTQDIATSPQQAAPKVLPRYPYVPPPGMDLPSLQTSVQRLKEGYEMMTGQTGRNEYSLVEGLTQIQKRVGANYGRMLELNEVVVNTSNVLVQHTEILEGEVFGTGVGTLNGRVTTVTAVVGDATTGLVKAVNDVTLEVTAARGTFGDLSGRLTNFQTVIGDASSGLVKATNDLTTEVTAARGTFGTLNGRVSSIQTVVGDASSGLVKASNDITAEVTTARNGQSTLDLRLDLTDSAVDGVEAKFGVTGTINGVTGAFTFSGVSTNDGSATFDMEFLVSTFKIKDPTSSIAKEVFGYSSGKFTFTGDVAINGNLMINGTVQTAGIAAAAVTQALAAVGTTTASLTITLRAGAKINVISSCRGYDAVTSLGASGTLTLSEATAGTLDTAAIGRAWQYQPSLGVSWPTATPTTMQTTWTAPADGSYTFTITQNWPAGQTVNMQVTELAR